MNVRNAPLSPASLDDSGFRPYPPTDHDGRDPRIRGLLTTPPVSGHYLGDMNGGFQPGPGSIGGPSPPPSVNGRSSAGTQAYPNSDNGRSRRGDDSEAAAGAEGLLANHYGLLKIFLAEILRDGASRPYPNKARDKLQRLSVTQFLELSTDVHDELQRRQSPNPPRYLPVDDEYHQKRNEARQKLANLTVQRFRDLATDVFCELERRYPRFREQAVPRGVSPMSVRGGPTSRSQTPVNGLNGYPRLNPRRPSEASSVRSYRNAAYGQMPPSPVIPNGIPSLPNGDYGRPIAKQFQNNTIVPSKSTMVEEDDESPTDRKLIDEYELQVRDLQGQLDSLVDVVKRKEEELNTLLDDGRARSDDSISERRQWDETRQKLENRLAQAQELNQSLESELERIKEENAKEVRQLREQAEDYRKTRGNESSKAADPELERENRELRMSLLEQQQFTDEVRREAAEFMREMKMLSQQSSAAWERHSELEKTIQTLESEVKEWRERYAKTKTRLRDMRAPSVGLKIHADAGKYVREKGFTQYDGLVKDVHVTKFQISIDELLRRSRVEQPEQVTESMKAVVVSVRRITRDIDESATKSEELAQQISKLRSRVSSTTNNLITTSKNYASSAGISPLSLVDVAVSHLTAAVVELLRAAKIRSTPADELEDEDGLTNPTDSIDYFSTRSKSQGQAPLSDISNGLPGPPPFQGLGGDRISQDSSTYSPEGVSREPYTNGSSMPRGREMATETPVRNDDYSGLPKTLASVNGNGYNAQRMNIRSQEVKVYLEDQMASLVQPVQNLVQLIRNDGQTDQVADEIGNISDIAAHVVTATKDLGPSWYDLVQNLESSRQRLDEAGSQGNRLISEGKNAQSREYRLWSQTLPPIVFEIRREIKELSEQLDRLD